MNGSIMREESRGFVGAKCRLFVPRAELNKTILYQLWISIVPPHFCLVKEQKHMLHQRFQPHI